MKGHLEEEWTCSKKSQVGGVSIFIKWFPKQLVKERWREIIKVVFIMMLVLNEQYVKCVMMNKSHKMMPYKKKILSVSFLLIESNKGLVFNVYYLCKIGVIFTEV